MDLFIRFVDRLADILAIVAGAMVFLAVLIVTYMVAVRLSGQSNYWELEASIYLSIGAIFLASPYCLRTGGHVGVDMLPALMGPRLRRSWRLTLKLVGLAVCLYLAWVGAEYTLEAYVSGERGHSLWKPLVWPLHLAVPVGMALTALQYVAEIFRTGPSAVDEGLTPL
ncbi:MAG: TRAP transporter small permease subunit [Reyranellaceae bacterium]